MNLLKLIPVITALFLALAAPASAQNSLEDVSDIVQIKVLPGWREGNNSHVAAFHITLAPGWKTYWRAPGDGGLPTHINWKGSENLEQAMLVWPRPKVFRAFGLRSIGYTDELVLPVAVRAKGAGDVVLKAQLSFGICEEICLPVTAELTSILPATGQFEPIITAALETKPIRVGPSNRFGVTCNFEQSSQGILLRAELNLPPLTGTGEALVVESNKSGHWVSEPEVVWNGSMLSSTVLVIPAANDSKPLRSGDFRFTVLTTNAAVEFDGCAEFLNK